MARSDIRGSEPGKRQETSISPEVETQAAELVAGRAKEEERPRRFGASRVLTAADRDRILKDARSVEFPVGLRGYDRTAVDRYVERINRLITELEMSSSPEAAVRHALDEVSEETRDILQRAHETADDITARSRAKADDRVQKAEQESREILEDAEGKAAQIRDGAQQEVGQLREAAEHETSEVRETTQREVVELRDTAAREVAETREAAASESQRMRASAQREAEELRATARRDAEEMLESAETRARELARSAEAIWRERRRLIEDMRAVGEQLVAIGETESKRFPRFGEEGSVAAELLHDPGATVAAGLLQSEQANGNPEVVPG